MTDVKCPECKSTDTVEWYEDDAVMNMMIWEPNHYFCYECGEIFPTIKGK